MTLERIAEILFRVSVRSGMGGMGSGEDGGDAGGLGVGELPPVGVAGELSGDGRIGATSEATGPRGNEATIDPGAKRMLLASDATGEAIAEMIGDTTPEVMSANPSETIGVATAEIKGETTSEATGATTSETTPETMGLSNGASRPGGVEGDEGGGELVGGTTTAGIPEEGLGLLGGGLVLGELPGRPTLTGGVAGEDARRFGSSPGSGVEVGDAGVSVDDGAGGGGVSLDVGPPTKLSSGDATGARSPGGGGEAEGAAAPLGAESLGDTDGEPGSC